MDDDQDAQARRRVARQVLMHLDSLKAAGIEYLPAPTQGARPVQARSIASAGLSAKAAQGNINAGAPSGETSPRPMSAGSAAVPDSVPAKTARIQPATPLSEAATPCVPALAATERADALSILRREVASCTRCSELAERRTQTVFGVGNSAARLCFVGEAPGADEDRQGEPFVGRAGQLLNKIIEACTLRREDVYILNAIKCRPPENRLPEPDELANCRGFFERQLEILDPPFICCLGLVAARAVLGNVSSLGRARGRFHTYRNSRVICTYHPAYLLRNPAAKKDTWEDMQMLMRAMGIA